MTDAVEKAVEEAAGEQVDVKVETETTTSKKAPKIKASRKPRGDATPKPKKKNKEGFVIGEQVDFADILAHQKKLRASKGK